MSGDGLPCESFKDRMALFKGKEKASGNKPPVISAPKQDRTNVGSRERGLSESPIDHPKETDGTAASKASTNTASASAPTAQSKAVPIPIVKPAEKQASSSVSSSPGVATSGSASPSTGSSVKDKIASLKAGNSASPSNDPPPERRKSEGGSKIAALAASVNVAAIGPRGVMPVKRVSITESMMETSVVPPPAPEPTSHVDEPVSKPLPEPDTVVPPPATATTTHTTSSSEETHEKASESIDDKEKRPQSSRIAALGGLVNVSALGAKPMTHTKHLTEPTEAVDEHVVPITHSHPPSLPAVKEEDENQTDSSISASESTSVKVMEPVAIATEVVEAVAPAVEATATASTDAPAGEGNAPPAAPKGEEDAPVVFADPTVMFSKKDALKPVPVTVVNPPGTKTSMISSRISVLALGVNVAALSGAPRPFNPHNTKNATSPTNAGANGFDAVNVLAAQVLTQPSPDLNHAQLSRPVRPKSSARPPSKRISGGFDAAEGLKQIS